ncbi:PD40 domain-containing protein [Luteimonas sp. SJ-92]|uniref:PD40 domain-containing protein n=1 Tax=Luteimonas salinisoli TaxID=2752307 RepID=A0A853JGM7_9GAMM|nr:PD40 domain-containing protein [Luteimonas salinisoli]NZA28573.1 PD40 domain-containing protein [Luteimonas salinisoli]
MTAISFRPTGPRLPRAILACCLLLAAGKGFAGELFAPGVVSGPFNETSAAFTPEGDTVYFTRGDFASSQTTILSARRLRDGYGEVRVAPFSGMWKDSEPHVSPDGKRLFFVSNRPATDGGASLTATMNGQTFPGANIWYVDRNDAGWGEPVRIDAELNRVPMVFNPSVAANGNLYFSAHREDAGRAYQIYMAPWTGDGYGAPQRLEIGVGLEGNHMDPAIDPRERFLLFAGNEGDSLGSADIYIVFRDDDGGWGAPIHLGPEINTRYLENAPAIGRDFGEIFVTSMRPAPATYPTPRRDLAGLQRSLEDPLNGSRNLWRFDISGLLREHGIGS